MVMFGGASGWPDTLNLDLLSGEVSGSLSLANPRILDYVATPEELNARATAVFNWITEGKIKMEDFTIFPLSEAKKAHDMLQGKKSTGKLLLKPWCVFADILGRRQKALNELSKVEKMRDKTNKTSVF